MNTQKVSFGRDFGAIWAPLGGAWEELLGTNFYSWEHFGASWGHLGPKMTKDSEKYVFFIDFDAKIGAKWIENYGKSI